MDEKIYINKKTGSVGVYNDWYYIDENNNEVNAVDRGEVIEVVLDKFGFYIIV